MGNPTVDVTIPVLNEHHVIEKSIDTLANYLGHQVSYDWSITVADNGSTDNTYELALAVADRNPRISVLRLQERGRGRALKHAWMASTADVVAYMDVDLSTGLEGFRPLVDPILEGSCDVAVGSRLLSGARVSRGVKREFISRSYNVIARSVLRYGVLDAQCGFKAIRTSLAHQIIPRIQDNGWFFDTELLALAHRNGLRVNQIPVDWVEDTDSRVRIVRTATDDLKGIWRLWRDEKRGGGGPGALAAGSPAEHYGSLVYPAA